MAVEDNTSEEGSQASAQLRVPKKRTKESKRSKENPPPPRKIQRFVYNAHAPASARRKLAGRIEDDGINVGGHASGGV